MCVLECPIGYKVDLDSGECKRDSSVCSMECMYCLESNPKMCTRCSYASAYYLFLDLKKYLGINI